MGQYYPNEYYTHHDFRAASSAGGGRESKQGFVTAPKSLSFAKQSVRNEMLGLSNGPLGKLAAWATLALVRPKIITRWRWGLFAQQGRLLDIGCGGGNFIHTLNNDWLLGERYETEGIDIDETAVAAAARLGTNVIVHDFPNTPYDNRDFDVVTMRHSLEHMYSPKAAIKEVFRLLRPGGTFVIEVPNISSWGARSFTDRWSGADAPRHLYHFTPESLQLLLESEGFKIETIRYWRGTFATELTLANQRRYYESSGFDQQMIRLRILYWRLVLVLLNRIVTGGAITVVATRA